ncbi:hypothetical protein Emag_004295 [Eimeria magna]
MESHVHRAASFSSRSEASSAVSSAALPKEESFAVLCDGLARLLASAYCEQDIKTLSREEDTTASSEALAAVGLDAQLLPETEPQAFLNHGSKQDVAASAEIHPDEHTKLHKNTHDVQLARFGSVRFSGAFSCNLEGGFCCVGAGKTAPARARVSCEVEELRFKT